MKPVHKKFLASLKISVFILLSISILFSSSGSHIFAQSITVKDMVTYSKQSNFIKEFEIPTKEIGLKGIAVDSQDNVWFYHSTNKTSTIVKLEPQSGQFTTYDIKGETLVDTPIINLAGGQLVFDSARNIIWFTDARTNSIGKLYLQSEKMELIGIPNQKAGSMGITLSPDGKSVWFTEIIANKIARLDVESNQISEYSTGEESGPTLLTFDDGGILWVTQSYSNSILRVQTGLLGSVISSGMSTLALPRPDTFSPFGIAVVTDKTGVQKMFVSDHSSSRVISSDVNSNLKSYASYWTSPSTIYPTTLPGQIVSDKTGNIYFPQHGGNRISKIDTESGVMTEYDIPTGPLSTALFVAVSGNGKGVWFTEWASNKIAYLDTTVPVPFDLQVKDDQIIVNKNGSKPVDVILTGNDSSFVSLTQVGLAVVGMSESGLRGLTYGAHPQWINMTQNSKVESQISLKAEEKAMPGKYNIMIRASASEKEQLVISKLYPISVILDVPPPASQPRSFESKDSGFMEDIPLKEITKFLAILVAAGLVGLLIYNKIKRSKKSQ